MSFITLSPFNHFEFQGQLVFGSFRRDLFQQALFHQFQINYPTSLNNAVIKRKSEFLAGRICAKKALSSLSLQYESVQVHTGEMREPMWPAGIAGAITHTDQIAIAAISNLYQGVGIDIEHKMDHKTAKELTPMILTPSERTSNQYPLDETSWISLIFSAKESLYKALYPSVQRFFDFQAAKMIDIGERHFVIELQETLSEQLQQGIRFEGQYYWHDDQVITLITV
ncbi:4'-phosphopantetheinyl transferase family protein [Algicola sagamiensis]|uniref:4'-phosphopantetheinyl transferase family protein n=1 Tax=Algicola sagamiensis TaxID=163869 RepID=UPI00037647E9|nr:4'-phosphopantetheinyl transferase superfamily protein [Algicola sagamiensis]